MEVRLLLQVRTHPTSRMNRSVRVVDALIVERRSHCDDASIQSDRPYPRIESAPGNAERCV